MSGKALQPAQQQDVAAPSASSGEGQDAQDFGSNSAMQDAMLGASASGDNGPIKFRVKSSRGSGRENTWVFDAIGPGTTRNVQVGDKVTCAGLSGQVDISRATSVVFKLYKEIDPGSLRGKIATFHRGSKYSYRRWLKENEKRKKKRQDDMDRADEANKGERDKAYRGRR
jgi:hypothetical protein